MLVLGTMWTSTEEEDLEAGDESLRVAYPYRYRYVVISLFMIVAASLLVLVASINVRHTSLFMLGLCLWFLAISGLRMSMLAFRHGAATRVDGGGGGEVMQYDTEMNTQRHLIQRAINEAHRHNRTFQLQHAALSLFGQSAEASAVPPPPLPPAYDSSMCAPPPKYDEINEEHTVVETANAHPDHQASHALPAPSQQPSVSTVAEGEEESSTVAGPPPPYRPPHGDGE